MKIIHHPNIFKTQLKNILIKEKEKIGFTKNFVKKLQIPSFCSKYSTNVIKKPINKEELTKLKIPNLRLIHNNSLRGEALSSKKNRWALKKIKALGIENIIDLRDKYTSKNYAQLCAQENLNYFHFPIDSSSIDDETIIQNFPLMFNILNKGRYYIACAQGLHRTDIALALNYVYNPNCKDIPAMAGHKQDNMDINDIKRRINSIYKKISDEQLKKLGWQNDARSKILERKEKLIEKFENDI